MKRYLVTTDGDPAADDADIVDALAQVPIPAPVQITSVEPLESLSLEVHTTRWLSAVQDAASAMTITELVARLQQVGVPTPETLKKLTDIIKVVKGEAVIAVATPETP